MSRKRRLVLTSTSALINQFITIVSGLILPRLYLSYFGSEVNGLVSSIATFLGFISFAECGVGAVVQSTLYKPLAEKNEVQISSIVVASEKFFRTIGIILLAYTALLFATYPRFVAKEFHFWFTGSLILIISISTFAQYFISMTYKLLLNADQVGYIQTALQSVSLVISTILCVILTRAGASIQIVRLLSSVIFLLQPAGLSIYVKNHYKINKRIRINDEPIKQKWNGLTQHISTVILDKTDVVVLTLFSTWKNISIYYVYYLVVSGVSSLLTTMTSGFQAILGNMYAKNERETLIHAYSSFEWGTHTLTTLLYSCVCVLITPFIIVYTNGITDANYNVPTFALLISTAFAFKCIRIPYHSMTKAAVHYKQTQMSALIEAGINISVSVALVFQFELSGIAIGTLLAMAYRTFYFVIYLSKNILERPVRHFSRHMAIDFLIAAISIFCCHRLRLRELTYHAWAEMALLTVAITITITFLFNFIFYREELRYCIKLIKNKRRGKAEND